MIIKIIKKNNVIYTKYNYIIKLYGDSHILCFVGSPDKNNCLDIFYNNKKYLIINEFKNSVSISGLKKNNSKTKYNKYIKSTISGNLNQICLFKLGQVDIEYIYYYKKYIKKENINFYDFCYKIINEYIYFLQSLNINFIICGSNLPPMINDNIYRNHCYKIIGIKDNNIKHEDINIQNSMNNILLFNFLLEKECKKNNIIYFDLINEVIDYKNNKIYVKKQFIENSKTIHYKGSNGNTPEKINDLSNYINNDYCKNTYYIFLNKMLLHISKKF